MIICFVASLARCPASRCATTLSGAPQVMLGLFLRGFAIQMTNPKAALAWIAVISLGIQAGAPSWVAVIIVGGTSLLSTVIHCLYALVVSTQVMVHLCGKARRWIQGALGLVFAFAGVKLLTSRLTP